jgi:hypothetical protein
VRRAGQGCCANAAGPGKTIAPRSP